jgi:transcriptional regulator with XRE-family HTH domain
VSFSARFGEVVREVRNRRGLSQEKLAELADLDRTFVSMIERGKRHPTLETAKSLAKALGVPLSTMIASAERRKP